MNRNTLFSILATAALGIVVAGPVSAQTTYTWKGLVSEHYHSAANWCPSGGPPGTGDKAIITPSQTPDFYRNPVLDDQDRSLGELVIGSGYSLTITGVKLTLDGTTTHDIDGELRLSDNTAQVEFTVDVTVDGDGEIVGQHNDAEIRIANDKTLTNEMIISGKMTILDAGSSGTFHNGTTGKVLANADGGGSDAILLLAAELTLSNCSTSIWEASNDPDAVLQFDEDATLTGLFRLDDCANIVIAANTIVSTSNTFKDKNGTGTPEGYVKTTSGTDSMFRYKTACDTGNFIDVSAVCTLFGTGCSACP